MDLLFQFILKELEKGLFQHVSTDMDTTVTRDTLPHASDSVRSDQIPIHPIRSPRQDHHLTLMVRNRTNGSSTANTMTNSHGVALTRTICTSGSCGNLQIFVACLLIPATLLINRNST